MHSARAQSTKRLTAAVVANRNSGSVEEEHLATLRARLDKIDGPKLVGFHAVAPDRVREAAEKALAQSPDMLIIVGGDGTARSVAEIAREAETPIAPLPFGTMNILAHRLYGDRSASDILTGLVEGEMAWLPTGSVNGHLFLLSAAAGFPVWAAQAREDLRAHAFPALGDAVSDALRTFAEAGHCAIEFAADANAPQRASALLLATADISGLLGDPVPWRDAAAFQLAAAETHNVIDLARLGARAVANEWRQDEAVHTGEPLRVRATIEGDVIVALDGDPTPLENPLEFVFEPRGVPVILPPAAQEPSTDAHSPTAA